mgnify:CR=1 FL=1
MLKIENLSTSYKTIDGDVHVLKDINFEIKDNEIFGIAGESGCGKTTLLNTLYDIVDYPLVIDQGRVVLEGEKDGKKYILIDTAGIRRKSKVNEDIER